MKEKGIPSGPGDLSGLELKAAFLISSLVKGRESHSIWLGVSTWRFDSRGSAWEIFSSPKGLLNRSLKEEEKYSLMPASSEIEEPSSRIRVLISFLAALNFTLL